MIIKRYFFETGKSASDSVDSVDITVCKVQNSIILILKFGKLG